MALSKAEICNLALAHIKQTKTLITNLDTDKGNVADQCRIHYNAARRFSLADNNWNFCTIRVALADVGSPNALWTYRYDYPSNCLKFREIQRLTKSDVVVPYAIELIADGSKLSILTDMASAVGAFTVDVENTGLFSPGYETAFSWLLASELAPALSGSEKVQQACLTVYTNYIRAAAADNASEGQTDPEQAAPWDEARLT